jgi:hypothetical protein
MLILEYNYLRKVLNYLNKKKSNVLSSEYKESYDFWKKKTHFFFIILKIYWILKNI